MLCRKAELLIYMKLVASLSAADEALLDLIHPLAEISMENYLQQELQYTRHIEYLPVGEPLQTTDYRLEDAQFLPNGAGVVLRSQRQGTDYLQLKHSPITTFGLEVREDVNARAGLNPDSQFSDDTILTLGTDYYPDADERTTVDGHSVHLSRSGILRRIGAWPVEPRTVKVTYYGGWAASQIYSRSAGSIRLAAMMTVSNAYWAALANADSEGRGPKMSESIGKYSYSLGQAAAASQYAPVPAGAAALLQPFRSYRYL